MEPVSIIGKYVVDYTTGKLMDKVVSRFHTDVIQRWTKKRSELFFQAFCQEVSKEMPPEAQAGDADVLLDMILEDEAKSEVLFDSYRRVCMSRSKDLGPRIIGILTAQLVADGRLAGDGEERVFMAAEQLNDDELLSFVSFYEDNKREAESDAKKKGAQFAKDGTLEIKWNEESIDSNWQRDTNISLSPLDLGECLGTWALKLKSLGFVTDDVRERQWEYKADLDGHIDEDGTMRVVSWWIKIPEDSLQLINLIKRV